jgi:DNA repair exonuclease SbcCD nuclease subunit
MKIAIINDTHFGFKNDHPSFKPYMRKFFDEVFFPYLENHKIQTVFHLGDVMDRRKYVNIDTLRWVREMFVDELRNRDVNVHVILGNHDTYYKNTTATNSLRELFFDHPHIHVYQSCEDVEIGGMKFAMIPWIAQDGLAAFQDFLKKTTATVALGHFELSGFELHRGVYAIEGMDPGILDQFSEVYSGHYHQRNGHGSIYYLGTQYDMEYSDAEETKGFHVYDTDTRTIDFIPNPHKLFYKMVYDDSVSKDMPDFKQIGVTGAFVKLVVKAKKHPKFYDRYLNALYAASPEDVKFIEEYELANESTASTEEVDVTQDTLSMIYSDIDQNEVMDDPTKRSVKKLMNDLYLESFETE